jgi:hypothetical protein
MFRAAAVIIAACLFVPAASAHHGGGTFDSTRAVTRTGTLTAHTLRRSGWSQSCYLNTIVLADGSRMDRYGQERELGEEVDELQCETGRHRCTVPSLPAL